MKVIFNGLLQRSNVPAHKYTESPPPYSATIAATSALPLSIPPPILCLGIVPKGALDGRVLLDYSGYEPEKYLGSTLRTGSCEDLRQCFTLLRRTPAQLGLIFFTYSGN